MDNHLTHDVCIIGGNIAGSYLAYLLASNGVSVVVVEQNRTPGLPLQCAGIVSQRFSNIVEIDPSIIINRVNTAWLILENGKRVSVSIQDNPYVLDRVKLDQYFYKKAESAGVRYLVHEKFLTCEKTDECMFINTNRRTIRAKILVGCDGPNSRVAKLHGITHNIIPAKQIRILYPYPNCSVSMYFKEYWQNLFGWIIPEGEGICRIGLGCKKNLKSSFASFLDEIQADKSHIIEYLGGQILIGYPKRIAFDRTILLGDAAGMVKATTGGGINTLLKASTYASEAILKSLEENKFSSQFYITHYQNSRGIRQLKRNILLHYMARLIMINFTQKDYEMCFLLLNQPKTKELLLKYGDMDFPLRFVLKILMRVDLWKLLFIIVARVLRKLPKIIRDLVNGG
ncbi:MAG: NAD(P)/FAD-dependent oxidoreductase [Candidatus Lokiarchaeota archaeon]|nr:NAD(P)/FAD-dependent oxidoreductase [Candidatus Lokiarchaeota archaeon]